jgi:hypothetical protein
VLVAESDDELLVSLLLAVLVQNTHVGLSSVEGLGGFAETTGETVVHEGELKGTLEGVENGHLTLGSIAGDLNLLSDLGGVVLFYVRLRTASLAISSLGNIFPPHVCFMPQYFPLQGGAVTREMAIGGHLGVELKSVNLPF